MPIVSAHFRPLLGGRTNSVNYFLTNDHQSEHDEVLLNESKIAKFIDFGKS